MAKRVLTNVRIFAGGLDLTGNSNKVTLAPEIEEKDVTNFGSQGWKELLGGLKGSPISASGQWEAGDATKVDDAMWAQQGSIVPWSVCPDSLSAAVGDLAYFTNALSSSYKLGDQVGEVAPWEGGVASSWPVVRGQVAHPAGTARTTTGTGTAINLGAVSSTQRLFAALHVLSVAGSATPTLTARIESAPTSGFAAPTTRATFTAATAVGGEAKLALGPVTDTWWRVAWTISGTTPSFLFVVAFGIA